MRITPRFLNVQIIVCINWVPKRQKRQDFLFLMVAGRFTGVMIHETLDLDRIQFHQKLHNTIDFRLIHNEKTSSILKMFRNYFAKFFVANITWNRFPQFLADSASEIDNLLLCLSWSSTSQYKNPFD